jgi:hypothetical protein
MPPLPKPAATRQRRNKAETAAKLIPFPTGASKVPPLPAWPAPDREWHPMTLAFWTDVWSSPMASEFLESDVHGLVMLATLVDAFWVSPSEKLAGEIRLQRQCFGLTPIDRRRLQWEVERVDEAQDRRARRVTAPGKRRTADPRKALAS